MATEWGFGPKVATTSMLIIEALYLLTWILATGTSILGLTIALNTVSTHATCTIVFSVVAMILTIMFASIRKISHLSWVMWIGFFSILAAVLIVVIGVSLTDRPAAAPQEGDFDLGFSALPAAATGFTSAFSASLAIFSSSANTPGYIPVLAEMKRPQDYNKALFICMAFINSAYLAFSTIVFYYCGQWVASPALGSAGKTLKIISYAIAIPGLIAGSGSLTHIAAKSLFVRLLRNSRHLTSDTPVHWIVWISCTSGIAAIGWLLSQAIPFFSQLISLIGSLCFGPIAIMTPALMWYSLNAGFWRRRDVKTWVGFTVHTLLFLVGAFVTVAGT